MAAGPSDRQRRFDALFDAYKLDVVAYCRWRAASPDDSEDAVSEVFLVAWRRLDEVPLGDAARVWLYATARRVIANQRRSRRRLEALRHRMGREPLESPHPPPARTEEALVHQALAKLGPRDREVLLLAEWEDLTPSEIAQVLGCLVVTARGRLHRARRRLREYFEALVIQGEVEGTDPASSRLPTAAPSASRRVREAALTPDVATPTRKAHT